uniref:Uncharacterized protein n=1 Tax=Sphenodon punctatus TaxID=8508 RepID=A0A8D0HMU6_SPHPU
MDSSFAANSSACGTFEPLSPGCPILAPGAWSNVSGGRVEGDDWNQSDPCNRTNSSQGDGSLCLMPGVSPSMITAITIMALYSIVCVVGLFGNFLVMYVIIR